MGRVAVKENVALAGRVRELWPKVRARYEGRVTLKWIKGHSGHKWNDRADELAELGRVGNVHPARAEWHEARDACDSLSPVSALGRFAFPARRTVLVRRDALNAKICMRTTIDRRDAEWVNAGCTPPRFHIRHDWTTRAEQLIDEASDADVGWRKMLGTSTIAVLLHPSVTDAAAARRGRQRFAQKLSREIVLHTVPQRDVQNIEPARIVWKTERFCEQEAVELVAAWCRPISPPLVWSDSANGAQSAKQTQVSRTLPPTLVTIERFKALDHTGRNPSQAVPPSGGNHTAQSGASVRGQLGKASSTACFNEGGTARCRLTSSHGRR